MTDLIGLFAACLTTLSFVPQAWLVIRTRQTAGISLAMYSLFTAGITLWLVYGILKTDLPLIIANLITIMLASVILTLKIRNTLRPPALAADAPVV